jgi:hypothetical protein
MLARVSYSRIADLVRVPYCILFMERAFLRQYIDGTIAPCVIRQYGPKSVRQ